MKKLSYFLSISAMIALVTFASCKKDETDPVDTDDGTPCAEKTYPTSTGDATVEIENFTTTSGDFTLIDAQAGDVLSLSLIITKGSFKTTKVRLYSTDCINELGTIASVAGQPKANGAGTEIDLRNTDDPQSRTVQFTVPSGMDPVYVTIEVDQSDGKNTHERIKIDVTNSGIVDSYTGISVGAQNNAASSRLIAATGLTYVTCDAIPMMDLIDVTFANDGSDASYLCSNPARFVTPISVPSTNVTCDAVSVSPAGGGATVFVKNNSFDFDNATETSLGATSFTSAPQYITVVNGDIILFRNADNKVGAVKITALNAPTGGAKNGTATLSVKIQR